MTRNFQGSDEEPGLARFYLIDQSLKRAGGHHADYALCVLDAAAEMGFDNVLGAHTGFQDRERFETLGTIKPVFRNSIYLKESCLPGLRHLTRAGGLPQPFLQREKSGWFSKVAAWSRYRQFKRRRNRRVREFAEDCERFFDGVLFAPGDHVFLAALSDVELNGLALFLSRQPRTLQVQWHVQFHFNLFEGRPLEYARQLGVARVVQSNFDQALSRIPYHSLHFYTTSQPLAEQFNRLGVAEFESLPYPVSQRFQQRGSGNSHGLAVYTGDETDSGPEPGGIAAKSEPFQTSPSLVRDDTGTPPTSENEGRSRPIRITCPGEMRREKGFSDYMQPLVDRLWESHLENGRVQFVVQRPLPKLFQRKKLEVHLPDPESQAIDFQPHPLPEADYVELLKTSDAGLLFYDSRVYYSRRAGVLGELLSCGKPVIVPAGSWLAGQVQPLIESHVRELAREEKVCRDLSLEKLVCDQKNVPLAGGVISFDDKRHPFQVQWDRNPDETLYVLEFDWHWPEMTGIYCQLTLEQTLQDGRVLRSIQVRGKEMGQQSCAVAFPVEESCTQLSLKFQHAFHDSNITLKRIRVKALDVGRRKIALGAVGVIAADQQNLAMAVEELVTHFDHYQTSAAANASHFYRTHAPRRTVARLLGKSGVEARSA